MIHTCVGAVDPSRPFQLFQSLLGLTSSVCCCFMACAQALSPPLHSHLLYVHNNFRRGLPSSLFHTDSLMPLSAMQGIHVHCCAFAVSLLSYSASCVLWAVCSNSSKVAATVLFNCCTAAVFLPGFYFLLQSVAVIYSSIPYTIKFLRGRTKEISPAFFVFFERKLFIFKFRSV